MSRRLTTRSVTALATALLLGAAIRVTPALAEQTTPSEDDLMRRIEALRPQLEEARVAAERAERLREAEAAARPRRPMELVEVGPLRIVTVPEQTELAEQLFGGVWRDYFSGVSGSPTLANGVFVFQWAWRRVEPLRPDPAVVGDAPLYRLEVTRGWVRSRGVARARVRDAIWSALLQDLPEGSELQRWVDRTTYPVAERVSRRVGIVASGPTRACLDGDDRACLTALGLAGEPRATPPESPAMILLEAVRLGGEGAWPRLLGAAQAPPAEALARAADAPPERVAAAWRSSLLTTRPEIHAGLAGQAGRVLIWVLALAAFAMRSTRWRLG